MERHRSALTHLCRVCGFQYETRRNKIIKSYEKGIVGIKLKTYYDIDITTDTDDIHPTKVCRRCYDSMRPSRCKISIFTWKKHTDNCSTCMKYRSFHISDDGTDIPHAQVQENVTPQKTLTENLPTAESPGSFHARLWMESRSPDTPQKPMDKKATRLLFRKLENESSVQGVIQLPTGSKVRIHVFTCIL